ncbi:hypothetical protein LTR10_024324 [Elasticomyces elasticus]|uniref:Cytochrome P450 n=1 Tax=Exophiala sideris TaxID=1016849 RepID=A0ABR0IUV0_9EURO|nr:hypothetical protein LTR10_024324 [Elasticomyces elasticus]KAK5020793.1 hypothetical protein LTS07_011429 [Exophiala sideris]KAK5022977.1 hypothetical protein LTR13_011378 [Exophiala sideris]KAK5048381.1 hypothetical protein LTR69_011420 [Exophiala sideris]KAK5175981.1 hypothetical protein LTR44_011458 [Eurotiomycetes sp. CCFEE 6388]
MGLPDVGDQQHVGTASMLSSVPRLIGLALIVVGGLHHDYEERPKLTAQLGGYVVAKMVYNVYLHPLSAYPGPKWWAASRVPWIWASTSGEIHFSIAELHKTYRGVVSIGPSELSYVTSNSWKQIYGHRTVEMQKDLKGSGLLPTFKNTESIVTASHGNHARMRRLIVYTFSEKALRKQEDLLQIFINQLMLRLEDKCSEGPQDLVAWFNWCTFDVTGDLAFDISGHKAVHMDAGYRLLQSPTIAKYLAPKKRRDAKIAADAKAYQKLDRRITEKDGQQRKAFMSYIPQENKEGSSGTTLPEIQETAVILVIAGGETTATLMSAMCYFMLQNPKVYRRVVAEVEGYSPLMTTSTW